MHQQFSYTTSNKPPSTILDPSFLLSVWMLRYNNYAQWCMIYVTYSFQAALLCTPGERCCRWPSRTSSVPSAARTCRARSSREPVRLATPVCMCCMLACGGDPYCQYCTLLWALCFKMCTQKVFFSIEFYYTSFFQHIKVTMWHLVFHHLNLYSHNKFILIDSTLWNVGIMWTKRKLFFCIFKTGQSHYNIYTPVKHTS